MKLASSMTTRGLLAQAIVRTWLQRIGAGECLRARDGGTEALRLREPHPARSSSVRGSHEAHEQARGLERLWRVTGSAATVEPRLVLAWVTRLG